MLSKQHTLLSFLTDLGEGDDNFVNTFTGVFRLLRDDEILDRCEPAAAFEADFGV